MTTAIVFSCIFFAASLLLLFIRLQAAPCCAFIGLLTLSFAKTAEGYSLLPFNDTIIIGWLCITVVVVLACMLQPPAIRYSRKGMGYMAVGAIAGMALGLLGFTFSNQVNYLYGIMILMTALGTFLGFLLFTNTPSGRFAGVNSGNFFRYLLAKGFPTAITVMQAGVVLVLIIIVYNFQNAVQ